MNSEEDENGRTILRFVISYGTVNIAREFLYHAMALRLKVTPGNQDGTYFTSKKHH
jgi:hypothetical protein